MNITQATTNAERNAEWRLPIYSPDGDILVSVIPSDDSYIYSELMGRHDVTLYFESPVYIDIPEGSFIVVNEVTYTLRSVDSMTMQHRRYYEYSITFDAVSANLGAYVFSDPIDGRVVFSVTGKPQEHLKKLVDTLTAKTGQVWSVGALVLNANGSEEGMEKAISYDCNTCAEALKMMSDAWNTEYEILGTTISLGKVERFKHDPWRIEYGKGKGLRPGVVRSLDSEDAVIGTLYVQGGERNIDASKYGSTRLHMPKSASVVRDGKQYRVDANGLSVTCEEAAATNEGALDCSEVFPTYTHEVKEVIVADKEKNFYDIKSDDEELELNYDKLLIEGETMTIVFQSGMLTGKEFEVNYINQDEWILDEDGLAVRDPDTEEPLTVHRQCFEIVPQEIDGIIMPSGVYVPRIGDKFKVFGVQLPSQYINNAGTQTGAEWELLWAAIKYLSEHTERRFAVSGEFDPIYTKAHWADLYDRFEVGSYFRVVDKVWMPEGQDIRITNVKRYLTKPFAPIVELSNGGASQSLGSVLRTLNAETHVKPQQLSGENRAFTKRRFRDAVETMNALKDYFKNDFAEAINPVAVHTMQMLVGDERLQFRFFDFETGAIEINPPVTYTEKTAILQCGQCRVVHYSIGEDGEKITVVSSGRTKMWWQVEAANIITMTKESSQYYLYISVPKGAAHTGGYWHVKEVGTAGAELDFETGTNYNLLVGVYNSVSDGIRSFAPLYGFTEILPSRITTDKIADGGNHSWLDLLTGEFSWGNGSLVWKDGKLTIVGAIMQTSSGGAQQFLTYRGEWKAGETYRFGDLVTYTSGGKTISYVYISATEGSQARPDSDSGVWQIAAAGANGQDGQDGQDGTDGSNGMDGIDGQSIFTSIVFCRSEAQPSLPQGGSFDNPVPRGWYDSIPDTDSAGRKTQAWMSNRIFTSDGEYPEDNVWSDPAALTDTERMDYQWSTSGTNPGTPDTKPSVWADWTRVEELGVASQVVWMAMRSIVNGINEEWKVFKIKGESGADGKDGEYHQIRFAANGSKTTPPTLNKTSLNPSGWSTTQPSVGVLQYLWMTIGVFSGNGTELLQEWTTPVRITPSDGKDGENGKDGSSPALVFRGELDKEGTYYGNPHRVDCVRYRGMYYVTRVDAEEQAGVPDGTGFSYSDYPVDELVLWNEFGATFESVATQLLLAEHANIGDWFMSGGKIVSTIEGTAQDKIELDAVNKRIEIKSSTSGGEYSQEKTLGADILLDAENGVIDVRSTNGSAMSYISPTGIFANRAGTDCIPATAGTTNRAAMVALGNGNVEKDYASSDGNFITGLYAAASNSGTAPAFGAYVNNLRANGLVLGLKKIDDTGTSMINLTSTTTLVIGLASSLKYVYLPDTDREGQTVIIKQIGSGTLRVYPSTDTKMYDDNTANANYDLVSGETLMAHYFLNGSSGCWSIGRFKY